MARFCVNGVMHQADATSGQTLLSALREDLGLTGAKYACGEGRCGACSVIVDGSAVNACSVGLDTLDGADVRTVESLCVDGILHPVQRAFVAERALQCGFCTPGMVMRAVALLAGDPGAGEAATTEALAGNVCRCGGYPRILRAVRSVVEPGGSDRHDPVAGARLRGEPGTVDGDGAETVWTAVLAEEGSADVRRRGWGWSTPGGVRLTIDAHGDVRGYVGKVDGGQGNRYALVRLVAAELGTSTSKVSLEMGDTDLSPADLGTFGSRSVPDAGHALRLVAAAVGRALVAEAATRWKIPVERVVSDGGRVRDPAGGRDMSYGELVGGRPRTLEVDWDEPVGPVPPRLHEVDRSALYDGLVAAVTGAKRFPSDLVLPGMLHARVLRQPAYGAELRALDTSTARRTRGVTVVEDRAFVAAVAPTPQLASAALLSFDAQWTPGRGPAEGELEAHLRAHPVPSHGWGGAVEDEVGDVDAALSRADVVLEATYTTAYIAHVPLETRSALARVDGDSVTVWLGTQRPFAVRWEVASALGVPEERVHVVVPDFGGGFGGKHAADVAIEAARCARATGRPVKVAWTREEEFRHAYFRPAAVIDVRSGAQSDGTLTGWELTNINAGAAALASPYVIADQRVRYRPADSPLPQGSYRALAATANNFARESHIDEAARALGLDAVELRLRHLRDERLTAVLSTVADRVDWPRQPGGEGTGIGLACGVEKDARVATAAEVYVDQAGRLVVRRIVTAFDCGAVVDPDGLRGQVVGATIMGLGGALFEAVHFSEGRVLNDRLSKYRVPRFTDVPAIEVVLLDRPEIAPAGAGETPIVAVAPALANAIRAATGRRLRSLPLAPGGTVPRDGR